MTLSISVQNISKAYKLYSSKWDKTLERLIPGNSVRHIKKWVLKNVSFDIAAGESVGIVGVNGAGKSTLLKLLTGTTKPTLGSIHTHGRVAALLELGMGFHPDFTGRQNVFMSGLMMGLSRDDIQALMPEIEKFADIGDYVDQPVRIYSSGMQMRLAFAVATCSRPDILIVDEALSVGDSRFQAKCYARIAEFKAQGTTLLLVSHSAGDIVRHCDRAIFLKNGEIALDASAREVTNRYLDELFGKDQDSKQQNADDSGLLSTHFNNEADEDLFHTRMGYRPEEYRWGVGGAKILDYVIESKGESFPSTIHGNELTDFYFKVHFENDYENIVPGFLIKTLDGLFLYGTNSFLASKGKENISVLAGETKIFKFSLPVNLNEGQYLVSFGVSSGNPEMEMSPLDRRYDSVIIHVSKKMKFWGLIDLQSSFENYDKREICK